MKVYIWAVAQHFILLFFFFLFFFNSIAYSWFPTHAWQNYYMKPPPLFPSRHKHICLLTALAGNAVPNALLASGVNIYHSLIQNNPERRNPPTG